MKKATTSLSERVIAGKFEIRPIKHFFVGAYFSPIAFFGHTEAGIFQSISIWEKITYQQNLFTFIQ